MFSKHASSAPDGFFIIVVDLVLDHSRRTEDEVEDE